MKEWRTSLLFNRDKPTGNESTTGQECESNFAEEKEGKEGGSKRKSHQPCKSRRKMEEERNICLMSVVSFLSSLHSSQSVCELPFSSSQSHQYFLSIPASVAVISFCLHPFSLY
mmetsp:Transcript_29677/g.58255  ORF Transcript_29677/g.58255 Transcript_29677/m.58255 type:complete len:114 (+) Transcript_29677:424-765(+)